MYRHTLGAVRSIVRVLLKIFSDSVSEKIENWSIFDEVIRRTKGANFWATLYINAAAVMQLSD